MSCFSSLIFSRNASRHSEIALVDHSGSRSVCWDDFRRLCFFVADYAKARKLKGIVPVYMDRSAEAFATVLGLNLAGIGVAPLAITTPMERCNGIAEQVDNAIWTAETFAKAVSAELPDSDWDTVIAEEETTAPRSDNEAYVVFTSGSTGTPKGVVLSDNAMIGGMLRAASADFFDYQPEDLPLQSSSFSFIAVAADLLAPLSAGCTVHILPEEARGDSNLLASYVCRHGVTTLFVPPLLYRNLKECPSLRVVCTGSDRIIQLAPKGHRLVGVYGMTECGGFGFHYDILEAMEITPIGVPSLGLEAYIVDENGQLTDEGELCLSGCVSHCYFHRPELNAQLITANPFSAEPGHEILLHSGDIVRRLPDGNLQFLNRRDNMLKINGQRVEPSEIELVLGHFDGIDTVAVKGFSDEDGRSLLCAYYTAEQTLDDGALRSYLEERLPHYMVPSAYIHLDKMPLNANGKLDRKALKLPDFSAFRSAYAAPRNEKEAQLCRAFERVLHLEKVGIHDDFFRMGGDSILALALCADCEELGLTTTEVFAGKTAEGIALLLDKGADAFAELERDVAFAPLTDSQMGVYLDSLTDSANCKYNIPVHITMARPALAPESIRKSLDSVLRLHPALYSAIENRDGDLFMVRQSFPAEGLCRISELTEDEIAAALDGWVQPIDVARGPLCRCSVLLSQEKLHILLDLHHIVSDGSSVSILLREFCAALEGKELPGESVDAFSLYEAEQRTRSEKAYDAARSWFEALTADLDGDYAPLPDGKASDDGRLPADVYSVSFSRDDISDTLARCDITESTLFMSAFGYALCKFIGSDSALFTVGESGRHSPLLKDTVSMLVRTLPVAVRLNERESGKKLMKELQSQLYRSISHDCISFAELSGAYGVGNAVSFVYQADSLSGHQGAQMELLPTRSVMGKLHASVLKAENGFVLRLEYRNDLYKEDTIRRFAQLFVSAVSWLCSDAPLCDMPLISPQERALLDSFNACAAPSTADTTVLDAFERSLAAYADKTAVVFKDHSYTYAQLDELSNRIAAYIHSQGIGANETVSVLVNRNEWIPIVSLGVVKSGAAYEPLDPSYPAERLNYMMQDARCRLLIAERSLLPLVAEYQGAVLFIDEIQQLPPVPQNLLKHPRGEDTVVLLYTSGTTGKPKGVMLSHRNILYFALAHVQNLQLQSDCAMAFYASYGFDAHIADLYPAFCSGAALHVIPEELRLDFPAMKDYFERCGITHAVMTTQVARQFAVEYPSIEGFRCLSCGGEKLLPFPLPRYRFLNLYGPSECTVCSSGLELEREYENIPIGLPFGGNRLYVSDSFGRRVPVGVPGELIISGYQVGKGYLNLPEKTAEVFVENRYDPDAEGAYARCYRTGDVVRYLNAGNLEFIGRRDAQVKIRGFRIELGEVEQVIRAYPGIRNAAVIAVDAKEGKSIHAYVVSDESVDIAALGQFIREQKPAYMVPAAILQIPSIPLTVNGKLDRRNLPAIEGGTLGSEGSENRSLTDLEQQLLDILRDIVGEGDYGVETEFTDAGITSITSIRLASQIYKRFGVNINTKAILNHGSILRIENAIVIQLLGTAGTESAQGSGKKLKEYPLTQSQMGIYLDSLRAGMEAYNIPMLLRLPESIDTERLKSAIVTAVKAHPSMLLCIGTDSEGQPSLRPAPELPVEVSEEELPALPPRSSSFSFGEEPLYRFRILHCGTERYLFIEAHHIIADGSSLTALTEDIDRAYRGESVECESYTIFDLALDEEQARSGKRMDEARAYYDSVFRGLSADYVPVPDTKGKTFAASLRHSVRLSPAEVEQFCRKNGITENVFFTAVFALVIGKYTAHENALISTIHAGRSDPRTERLAAMLVKTLPLYVNIDAESKVGDFLREVQTHVDKIRQYDFFTLSDAAKEYGLKANTLFVYQGRMLGSTTLDGQTLDQIELENALPKADVALELFAEDEGYSLVLECDGGHYSEKWIYSFADAYATCADFLLNVRFMNQIQLLSRGGYAKYRRFNDTEVSIPYRPAYRLLEERAALQPDAPAVVAHSERETPGSTVMETLSYSQLDHMANALAHRLLALQLPPQSPVGILCGRTKEVHISEFGILKAGGAFLYLSPGYPDDRVSYIVDESEMKAIVTTRRYAEEKKALLASLGVTVVFADDIDENTLAESPSLDIPPEALAYLTYTSGSTGKPKGVMIPQRALVNISDPNEKNLGLTPLISPVIAAVFAFTFDASVITTVMAISAGMCVCIASEEELHDAEKFRALCLENHVTSLVSTPSFLTGMMDLPEFTDVIQQLEAVECGGESFPKSLYEKLSGINPALRIINAYGPSEATVACSAKLLTSGDDITIGTPLNNYKLYVVDKQYHVLPLGALGELVVLGVGVGLGYMNRDDLTQKVFKDIPGDRAYLTGDLALISHDGEIEFHGRLDNQVKLRGLRIELGEIESAINSYKGVKNCIVMVMGPENNRFLAAYYTAEYPIAQEKIIAFIGQTLATYMVPRVFMQLDSMPLTSNGKIDKKALPDIQNARKGKAKKTPKDDTEKILCELYQEVLGLDEFCPDDNFFEMGGSSLSASRVVMLLKSRGVALEYQDIFDHQTPEELGIYLKLREKGSSGSSVSTDEDPTPEQYRAVLAHNTLQYAAEVERQPLGNVLLTGVTGFLGIHVLRELLEKETGIITCLARRSRYPSGDERLNVNSEYYFSQLFSENYGNRLRVVEGDITSDNLAELLKDVHIDTIINCAASVKHFAADDSIERVNVGGVEKLIAIARERDARLIQISTTSVIGAHNEGSKRIGLRLKENLCCSIDDMGNKYIISKLHAEEKVLEAIGEGLRAKIIRVGNLMGRHSDGDFQMNMRTNAFLNALRGFVTIGKAPISHVTDPMEFSPVDKTAEAIVLLSGTNDCFTMFHASERFILDEMQFFSTCTKCGLPIEFVPDEEYYELFRRMLGDESVNERLGALLTNDRPDMTMVPADTTFTANILYRLGFSWPYMDQAYLERIIMALKTLGFFN